MKIFYKEKPIMSSLITPKNSPLVPIFKREITKLQQAGAVQYLLSKWEGQLKSKHTPKLETVSLSAGLLILSFIIMSSAFGLTCLIFQLEMHYWKKARGWQKK